MDSFYRQRRLAEGYPDLPKLAHEKFSAMIEKRKDDLERIENLLGYLNRLIDVSCGKKILVLGCGPKPQAIQIFLEKNYDVIGVEPVSLHVQSANEYLGSLNAVLEGAAEQIPLPDASQDVIFFESVLEHVDSPDQAIKEIFRVLRPGGIAYITTTNRYKFSLTGDNGEFDVPFYNWLPRLVKECIVFHQLHYKPSLAGYTERPAVHWWSYSDLCDLGRRAGFGKFYSLLDLVRPDDPNITKSALRRFILPKLQRSPWLRALALTQLSGEIIMFKRLD